MFSPAATLKNLHVNFIFFLPPLQGRVLLRPPTPQRHLGGWAAGRRWVSSWVWGRGVYWLRVSFLIEMSICRRALHVSSQDTLPFTQNRAPG